MDYGSFELVQTCHCLTRVTEDLERFLLAEARLQTLVHKVHHLTTCTHTNIEMQNTTILQKHQENQDGIQSVAIERVFPEVLEEN